MHPAGRALIGGAALLAAFAALLQHQAEGTPLRRRVGAPQPSDCVRIDFNAAIGTVGGFYDTPPNDLNIRFDNSSGLVLDAFAPAVTGERSMIVQGGLNMNVSHTNARPWFVAGYHEAAFNYVGHPGCPADARVRVRIFREDQVPAAEEYFDAQVSQQIRVRWEGPARRMVVSNECPFFGPITWVDDLTFGHCETPDFDAGFPDAFAGDVAILDLGVHPDAEVPDSGVHPDAEVPDTGPPPDAGHPPSDYQLALDGVDEAITLGGTGAGEGIGAWPGSALDELTLVICGDLTAAGGGNSNLIALWGSNNALLAFQVTYGTLRGWGNPQPSWVFDSSNWADDTCLALVFDGGLTGADEVRLARSAAGGVWGFVTPVSTSLPAEIDIYTLHPAENRRNLCVGSRRATTDALPRSCASGNLFAEINGVRLVAATPDALTLAELEQLGRGGALLDAVPSWASSQPLAILHHIDPAFGDTYQALVDRANGNDSVVENTEPGDLAVVP